MTKREFDRATKWNHGGRMPSDTREAYRQRRQLPVFADPDRKQSVADPTRDRLKLREWETLAARRTNPSWATLGIQSRHRAPARFHLTGRRI